MAELTVSLSVITLNVNGLNYLIITKKMAEWIKKHDPIICYERFTLDQRTQIG